MWMVKDNVAITAPLNDPLYPAIMHNFATPVDVPEKLLLCSASAPASSPLPVSTGLLIVKRGWDTLRLMDELLSIGRQGVTFTCPQK